MPRPSSSGALSPGPGPLPPHRVDSLLLSSALQRQREEKQKQVSGPRWGERKAWEMHPQKSSSSGLFGQTVTSLWAWPSVPAWAKLQLVVGGVPESCPGLDLERGDPQPGPQSKLCSSSPWQLCPRPTSHYPPAAATLPNLGERGPQCSPERPLLHEEVEAGGTAPGRRPELSQLGLCG